MGVLSTIFTEEKKKQLNLTQGKSLALCPLGGGGDMIHRTPIPAFTHGQHTGSGLKKSWAAQLRRELLSYTKVRMVPWRQAAPGDLPTPPQTLSLVILHGSPCCSLLGLAA